MSTFGKILASAPVNKQAAMALSRGIHWTPNVPEEAHFTRADAPLPIKPFNGEPKHDLSGKMFGRLTVIGQANSAGKNCNWVAGRGVAWVVRCSCGAFEHRRTKSLKKMDVTRAMCRHCDHLEQIKAGNKP